MTEFHPREADDQGLCGRPIGQGEHTCTLRPGHTGDCMWINPHAEESPLVRALLSPPTRFDRRPAAADED